MVMGSPMHSLRDVHTALRSLNLEYIKEASDPSLPNLHPHFLAVAYVQRKKQLTQLRIYFRMVNEVAENVLGTIGTVLWCIQLVPQIIRNYKVKDCTGLPPVMMFLWCACGVPFLIYFNGTNASVPLKIQPVLFTFFCLISWVQSLYYPPVEMPKKKLFLYVAAFLAVAVGSQVGFILWLRPLYNRDIKWPMLIIGIVASILLVLGLVPPYFELAKRKGRVVGINFVFLSMDASGAFFSLLSVVVGNMDVMSLILYALVLVMELVIFASAILWYLTGGREILKQEKLEEARNKDEISDKISETQSVVTSSISVNAAPPKE